MYMNIFQKLLIIGVIGFSGSLIYSTDFSGRDPKDLGLALVSCAGRNVSLSHLQSLLDGGADVNYLREDGKTALIMAAKKGQTDLVRWLLDRGANVNLGYFPPLVESILNGHDDTTRLLLGSGADVDVVLNLAVDLGHNRLVEFYRPDRLAWLDVVHRASKDAYDPVLVARLEGEIERTRQAALADDRFGLD